MTRELSQIYSAWIRLQRVQNPGGDRGWEVQRADIRRAETLDREEGREPEWEGEGGVCFDLWVGLDWGDYGVGGEKGL